MRCKTQHEATIGLFAEDLKRNHKLAVAAGLLPATTKPEKSVRGEPLDPSIDDAVHALVQSLPDMKPPAAALDQPARRHLGNTPNRVSGRRRPAQLCRAPPRQTRRKAKRAQYIAERIRAAGHERRKLGELPDDWTELIEDFQRDFFFFSQLR